MLTFIMCGCAADDQLYVYKLYPGPQLAETEVATIRFGSRVFAARVDGLEFRPGDYDRVHVLPGEHLIDWHGDFWDSYDSDGSDNFTKDACATVDLEKGVVYILGAGDTEMSELELKYWIQAENSGAILFRSNGCFP